MSIVCVYPLLTAKEKNPYIVKHDLLDFYYLSFIKLHVINDYIHSSYAISFIYYIHFVNVFPVKNAVLIKVQSDKVFLHNNFHRYQMSRSN